MPFFLHLKSSKGLLEDKGKGKEVKTLPEAKGKEVALKIKDVDSKANDTATKVKNADSKAKDATTKAKNADPKDDPPRTKA
nr:hypothetical protein CFP56_48068 [Quercus suber]